MPWPSGLVVKNGSKARAITSGVMPVPVSVTQSETYWPGGRSRSRRGAVVEPFVGGLDGQPAAVRHGVARVDAQVEQRVFELVGIDQRRPQAAGADHLDRDVRARRVRRIRSSMPAISRLTSVGLRIERLAAREGEQPVGQRRGARRPTLWRGRRCSARRRRCRPCAMRCCSSSRLPVMPGQQVVEVMRDAAGELADRLHLLRLAQLLLALCARAAAWARCSVTSRATA